MTSPIATIVITTRDRQSLADRAVASALGQDAADLQVVVVDDGSNPPFQPGTADERMVLIRNQRPLGPSGARNRGLDAAEGQWIAFLDDDDVLLPEMIRVSIEAADASSLPAPVSVLSGAQIVTPEGEVLAERLPPSLPRGRDFFLEDLDQGGSFQTHATLVAPVSVVRSIGGWDETLPASEHDDFFLRLNAASSIEGLQVVTYRITAHRGARLSKAVLERAKGMDLTVTKHKDAFRRHPRRYGHYLGTMGVTYLRAGKWGPAVRATTRSLLIDPGRPKAYLWWLAALAGPWPIRMRRRMHATVAAGRAT